ncbi:hypothetical protein ACIBSW_32215 [Actinoplanes sp. NPDC049668]|uniref:hypothetical protein n=1 Tax=unclassified Actinoplanes TaxID=2626549 RepID=UPI0033BF152B
MSDGVFVPSGATPWSAYNTPRIWAMVEGEDDPESWRQVAALAAMAGLLDDQRKRLQSAKESLARAWPPEQNKAAAAFVDVIDDLLLNMAENKRIADSNAGALSQVLEALRQAKTAIEPLYQSYLDKSDDWVPGWWDKAEDELDEKAREQMRGAERIVAHPDNTIRPPDLYEFKPRAVVSDPVADPRQRGSGPGGPSAAGGLGGVVDVPHDPPPPLPNSGLAGPNGATPGPALAEVITSPGLPPPGTGTTPQSSPAPPGLVIGGGPPGATGIGGLPGAVRPPLGRGGQRTPGGGGVSAKPVPPSWLPQGSGPTGARANGQPSRGGAGQGAVLPGSPAAGSRSRGGERGEPSSFDPDNPWVTAEGVPPVIEPSRVQPRHDPGPGVIGWHE